MGISKEELKKLIKETFKELQDEQKAKEPKTPKAAEKLEIEPTGGALPNPEEISDKDLEDLVRTIEKDEKPTEPYECPCGYKANEKFEKCPQCGSTLSWD